MSLFSKLIVLGLTLTVVAACNSSSGSSNKTAPNVVENQKRCVPESELLSPSNGIVGGQRVDDDSADAKKVVMVLSSLEKDKAEICTASLIAPDVLLTAAHCIAASADKTYVITHSSISCESGFDAREHVERVSEVVANEKYDSSVRASESQNDVALIFLKSYLWSYPVYKIAKASEVTDSNTIYFYGYGTVGYQKGGSGILRKTQVDHAGYSIDEASGKVKIDQTKGTGVCSGDSGGPGLVFVNNEWKILGVNSYVDGTLSQADYCQGQGYLALADKYREWIRKTMEARGRHLSD